MTEERYLDWLLSAELKNDWVIFLVKAVNPSLVRYVIAVRLESIESTILNSKH
jgi:hypothetical protein